MALGAFVEAFARENNISNELATEILKEAMVNAYKKKFGKNYDNVEVKIDKKITMRQIKEVAETVEDEVTQITAENAENFTRKQSLKPGDKVKIPVDVKDFSRQIAQIVKQVLNQRISEIQKDIVYNEFCNKIGQVFIGKVKSKTDNKYGGYYVSIEPKGVEAFLPYSEAIPDERFDSDDIVKFLLIEVKKISKKGESQLILSRKTENLTKELLRMNIPEIADGTFIIRAIARKPGEVSKVVLDSLNDTIDPISVTVGKQGVRIKPIRSELGGNERIEIIRWNEDPRVLISNAIKASRVLKNRIAEVFNIELNSETKDAIAVVPDEFLAPLIGKGGSHQKMLEKITGWHIRFKPYSEYEIDIAEKQRQVDEILGISADEEVEVIEEESIPISMLPFSSDQLDVLKRAGFEDVVEIVEFSIEELASRCQISLDEAVQIWRVIESNVEIEEEEV
jgi:N utilization substance protein A